MSTDNMMYNSQLENLVIPEYGRNIQNMINAVRELEDKDKRQRLAEAIVDLMHQMHPTDKHNPEYKNKLWKHLFRIANYDIDVTTPDGVVPTPETTLITPLKIEYPDSLRRYRHYGRNVQTLIDKAVAMEDGEKKEEFVMIIASYMKLAYRTWNREHFVSDDVIKQDLYALSGNTIQISEDDNIIVKAPMPSNYPNRGRSKNNRKGVGRQSNRNNNHRNSRNNNRKRR